MISNREILNTDSRNKIYGFIEKNPGIHQTEISKTMNMPRSTLRYHLKYLMKQNLIRKMDSNSGYSRYIIVDKLGTKEKELLSFIRQEVPRNILIYMTASVICSLNELSRELHKSPSTINFHFNKLMDLDIITIAEVKNGLVCRNKESHFFDRQPVKSEKFYRLKSEEVILTIIKLLIRYKRSIPEIRVFSGLLDFILSTKNMKRPKIMDNEKKRIDKIEEMLFDAFPHPYHV